MTYNILKEPWIKTENLDGTMSVRGLLDTIENSDKIRRLAFGRPMHECGVLIFTIIFLMDALREKVFEDEDDEDIFEEKIRTESILSRGHMDDSVMARISQYVKECEAEGVSFDLFDELHPFGQMWGDPETDKDMKLTSVAEVDYNLPCGDTPLFINNIPEDRASMTPADFMVNLCTLGRYVIPGGCGWKSGIFGEPPSYMLAEGRNLFETLLLNVPASARQIVPVESNIYGKPFYRKMGAVVPNGDVRKEDLFAMELMTFPVRRFRAVLEEDGLIHKVWKGHGFDTMKGFVASLHCDPFKAYSFNEKKGYIPIPFTLQTFWENIETMLVTNTNAEHGSMNVPLSIRAAMSLTDEKAPVRAVVYSAENNKAAYVSDKRFSFSIPNGLFSEDEEADSIVRQSVIEMISAGKAMKQSRLRSVIKDLTLIQMHREPTKAASPYKIQLVKRNTNAAMDEFSSLLTKPFFEILGALARNEIVPMDAAAHWGSVLTATAQSVYDRKVFSIALKPDQKMKTLVLRNKLKHWRKEEE